MKSLTEQYADFCQKLNWDMLPSDVHRMAADLFADWLANAVAGCTTEFGTTLVKTSGWSADRSSSLITGTLTKTDPLNAAFVNAGAAHSLEFDDSYRVGLYHPGASIFGAAFAASSIMDCSPKDMLTGAIAGYEISMRLAKAVNPSHYRIWHTTGTIGTFGAAASAAFCLGLNARQTVGALGYAGTQASGLWEVLSGVPQAKNLHPAKAAHAGLLSALLARDNSYGPVSVLEGPRGIFSAMVPDDVDHATCISGLGEDWLIRETTLKAYPVCGHTMTSIEAALALADRITTESIESIDIRTHPVSIQVADRPIPQDCHEAKFSIQYCVATALLKKQITLAEFTPELIQNPAIKKLLGIIRLSVHKDFEQLKDKRPSIVAIKLKDGRGFSKQCETRRGDPENPLSEAEKRHKFINLAGLSWGVEVAESIYNKLELFTKFSTVEEWIRRDLMSQHHEVEKFRCSINTQT